MKCPTCEKELREEFEVLFGEKFPTWYCSECKETFELVSRSWIEHITSQESQIVKEK